MNVPTNPPGVRLLLVDDHTIVREGLKRILKDTHEGWHVTEESSGFQALDCLHRAHFDLAIIDRFHTYVPGWEIPKNKDENLTRRYGLKRH